MIPHYHDQLISVCVCTYKRPHLLKALLKSLVSQKCEDFTFEVVVVDNDFAGSASEIVVQIQADSPNSIIRYEIEPEQGISFARNRTVRMAKGQFLAFIDDDESASPTWLSELLGTLKGFQADAVAGPVLPRYPADSPQWVIKSCFFERPRFATGTMIHSGDMRTSNVLVCADWCRRRAPVPFDPQFARSGGEDYDFFKWVESSGGRFCWCDSATVEEMVPLCRQSLRFMLERKLRTSVVYWRHVNAIRRPWRAVAESIVGTVGGTILCFVGCCLLPFGLHKSVRAWGKGMNGFGRLLALSNIRLIGYGGE